MSDKQEATMNLKTAITALFIGSAISIPVMAGEGTSNTNYGLGSGSSGIANSAFGRAALNTNDGDYNWVVAAQVTAGRL